MKFVTEPGRRVPVAGEYDAIVLGGRPGRDRGGRRRGPERRPDAARRALRVPRRQGTAAGVTNFCGLFANVHGEIRRVVHGVADDLLDRIERLGGLNAPHPVFGRTMAQAYDMSAYKCAADDLLAAAGDRHHLLGLAAITLVLGITYWLMRERDDRMALASGSARPSQRHTL